MKARYPGSADGRFPGGPGVALHDPFVALSFVAAQTTTLKLGTGVFVLPLRNTLSVAKAVASLDVLSQGRVLFGIGVGWCEEELTPLACRSQTGRPHPRSGQGHAGAVDRGTPRFDGAHHRFEPVGLTPNRSSNPHPPLIFGGESRAALKRTAELADGWCGIRYTPDSVKPTWRR